MSSYGINRFHREMASSEKLCHFARDAVDESVMTMISKEGVNKSFNPYDYVYLTVFGIIANTVFGNRYYFA